jgi:hypothetical protein
MKNSLFSTLIWRYLSNCLGWSLVALDSSNLIEQGRIGIKLVVSLMENFLLQASRSHMNLGLKLTIKTPLDRTT